MAVGINDEDGEYMQKFSLLVYYRCPHRILLQ